MEKDKSDNGKGIAGIIILVFLFLSWGEKTVHDAAYDNGYEEGYEIGSEKGYEDGYSDAIYEFGYSEDDLKEAYEDGYSDYEFGLFQWSDIEEVEEAISKLQDRRKELLEEN